MFILIFFIVLSVTQFINNKTIGVSEDSEDAYSFNRRDSLIIAILFIVGIVLQIVSSFQFMNKIYWVICGLYFLVSIILLLVLLQIKKTSIVKKREEMQQIYEILQKLVDKKGEGLDFNEPPFILGYKYGNIQDIKVNVEPTQFSSDPEKSIMPFIPQLNAFLPTFQWGYELHLDQRYIEFIGEDKPPNMARWPGSWLRHFRYMPMGLSGKGEIAYQPDSVPKDSYGESQFKNEHGDSVGTDTSLPTQPQGLICGATGGGKSVAVQNVLIHCIEHRNKIALGLIDPKQVEFSNYKGMNGIVGVATSTLESVELLRIARQVMLKRNKEMAALGIKSLTDYVPTKKSGRCFITGREFNDDDTLKVKIDNQEKSMSCSEFIEHLHENKDSIEQVCLNEEDWVSVNHACCDHIYEDEFPILLIICDELAELTQKSGVKSAQAKEEDAMKDEIISIIQSITQLGRSAGVLMLLCTQKPNATIVPTVIRSNTGFRCFCGRAAESGASLVALDNTLATTIDNTFPGAGIIQSAGNPAFVRYYFSKFEDLYDYYKKRGLDELGYEPGHQDSELVLENLEGEEEIKMTSEDVLFEFEKEKAVIDKREDQNWEEI